MRMQTGTSPSIACVPGLLLGLGLTAFTPSATPAQGIRNVDGFAEVAAVQSESDGERSETLRQEYVAHWSRQIVPYLGLRASMRYLKFEQELAQPQTAFREEIQPAGEIAWRHPLLSAGSSFRRRSTDITGLSGRRINDNFAADIKTFDVRYPILHARYEFDRVFNPEDPDAPETKNKRLQAGADYDMGGNSFLYSFRRNQAQNVVSGLESLDRTHLFRWDAFFAFLPEERAAFTSSYAFTYNTSEDEVTGAGEILSPVPVLHGLYAEDPSPEVGSLARLDGLADGDTQSATEPPVDIGGNAIDRNLGVALSFEREVSALYIYVDRIPASGIQWQVFISEDNLNWEPLPGAPEVEFNTNLERYEIQFGPVTTRFLKVVNSGFSEIFPVFVTELQALEELQQTEAVSAINRRHLADAGLNLRLSDRLQTSAGVTFQRDPLAGRDDTRTSVYYSAGARYRQSDAVRHIVRLERGFQELSEGTDERRDDNASYSMLIDPLETMNWTLSASH
ncbi:MAG: hypothetical protein GF355_14045, partial [Candidatus Eisenbacteria bacterium]|nr:hypothetical protein [Candidatus Eisenbacteria bacterium]